MGGHNHSATTPTGFSPSKSRTSQSKSTGGLKRGGRVGTTSLSQLHPTLLLMGVEQDGSGEGGHCLPAAAPMDCSPSSSREAVPLLFLPQLRPVCCAQTNSKASVSSSRRHHGARHSTDVVLTPLHMPKVDEALCPVLLCPCVPTRPDSGWPTASMNGGGLIST